LERLQGLYKSDARIADVLNVPEYLVAYWRRKKRIPRFSAPKFSHQQIADVWARFGDDFRCGRELNISKAAFYSWRRKYEIKDRPAFLKLEQLELRLAGSDVSAEPPVLASPRTAALKIWHRCHSEWASDDIAADWRLTSRSDSGDDSLALSPGPDVMWPRSSPQPEAFPAGEIPQAAWISPDFGSIEWQLVESRAILPGRLLVGPKGLATGIGGIACLYLEESAARNLPRVIKIEVTRKLGPRVEVEDIIAAALAQKAESDWSDAIVEFLGGPIERLSLDRKVKLCSLAVKFGAQAALCAFDDIIRRHFGGLLKGHFPLCHPDRTAAYDGEHFLEGRGIEQHVIALDRDGSHEVAQARDVKSGGVLLGPQALPYEIELAAELLRGRRIPADRPFLVAPATPSVYRLAQRRGWAEMIVAAGGSVLDVGLTRRLGITGLLNLATGGQEAVWCTRPPCSYGLADGRVLVLGSVHSVVEQLGPLS
jgi:hypothetical protein